MNQKTIKVGIIGCGVMGSGHAKFLTDFVEGAKVSAVYDAQKEAGQKLASSISNEILICESVDELIESIIAEFIREAKPMSLSRDIIMSSQDIQPNLFWRDFYVTSAPNLQKLLKASADNERDAIIKSLISLRDNA